MTVPAQTIVSHTAARSARVYLVLDPDGRPVGPSAFASRTAAASYMMAAHPGRYWPQIEAEGYRIVGASLAW